MLCIALALFTAAAVVPDKWTPIGSAKVDGILGKRLRLWRDRRLWHVTEHPLLLSVFEGGPGSHADGGRAGQGQSPGSSPMWQGEHAGKWLHAATLAYEATRDDKLLGALQEATRRLLAAQESNGYLGTYLPRKRFYASPDADTPRSWDVWTQRYCLYGLLTFERFHPDNSIVTATTRIGDLLNSAFGSGKMDITQIGTRRGISSTTVLESVMMLYERTGEKRFLRLAEQIVRAAEANPKLRLLSAMLEREDASIPGDGKAYQLMANLLGFGELYRFTGDAKYLRAIVNGWENILAGHLYDSGGPWSYASTNYKNQECFAAPDQFLPSNIVETCSATTWVQLSLQLLRITGESRYAAEAERAILNQLFAAQALDGISWATHPAANTPKRKYVNVLDCCASSGPRALELYARHLIGTSGRTLSVSTYLPLEVSRLSIRGDYPFADRASLALKLDKPTQLAIDFSVPRGARSVIVQVNGKPVAATKTPAGFFRVDRTWNPSDRIEARFDFRLEAHTHQGRDGRRWTAFTFGPILLAREITLGQPPELTVTEGEPAASVERVPGKEMKFRMKESGAALIPYSLAGSGGAGVQTYFPIASTQ